MIIIKRNDTYPPITSTFSDDAGALNLTGSTVRFIMRNRDTGVSKVNAAATIVAPATDGKVQYAWGGADTDTVGVYKAEWQITFADATVLTVPTQDYLYIQVVEDLG